MISRKWDRDSVLILATAIGISVVPLCSGADFHAVARFRVLDTVLTPDPGGTIRRPLAKDLSTA